MVNSDFCSIILIPIFLSFIPPPSDIPAVALCPPDSDCAADFQLTVLGSEAELCASCSSLGRRSSSCQLYQQVCLTPTVEVCTPPSEKHTREKTNCYYDTMLTPSVPSEVPQGPEVGPYEPLQPHRCRQYGPAEPKTCHDTHSHATGGAVGQTADSYGSAHQLSCQETGQCHWLQGQDSGTEKLPQRPVATGRSVSKAAECLFSLSKCVLVIVLLYLQGWGLLLYTETVSEANYFPLKSLVLA